MKSETKSSYNKHQSNLDFKGMAFFFKVRDVFKPPIKKIKKSKIKKGDYVLDYGCGPGSYTSAAFEVVGEDGRIYAADIHLLAINRVKKKTEKKHIENIKTILTDCNTGLDDNSIDVVICFDVMHDIEDKEILLKEFHRVLKPYGYLSFNDHHYNRDEILNIFSNSELFELEEQIKKIYNFKKIKN